MVHRPKISEQLDPRSASRRPWNSTHKHKDGQNYIYSEFHRRDEFFDLEFIETSAIWVCSSHTPGDCYGVLWAFGLHPYPPVHANGSLEVHTRAEEWKEVVRWVQEP